MFVINEHIIKIDGNIIKTDYHTDVEKIRKDIIDKKLY